jgi:sugar phosphate permease
MVETHTSHVHTEERRSLRRAGPFILSGLSGGHSIFHWFTQSLLVMLPEVRETFALSAIQVGAITTTREVVAGMVALPGGVAVDLLRRHWGLVLAGAMAVFGLGWLVMGLSGQAPSYPVLLVGMGMVAAAASIWHLPAVAALSHHFAHRRGAALSFHGIGGNIGDVLGPALTGFLLGILAWQRILSIYAVVPLFLAFLVFWAFRDIGRTGASPSARPDHDAHARPDRNTQMVQTRPLVKSAAFWLWVFTFLPLGLLLALFWLFALTSKFRAIKKANQRGPDISFQALNLMRPVLTSLPLWGITLVAALRGMAFVSFITFLPLYLEDELHLSKTSRGLHLALLVLVGIGATPIAGYLSDRLGRKIVLIPGLLGLCALTLLLVPFGQGVMLVVILGLLGLFLYSDQPILTAAALDIVGEGVAATTLGVLSFSRFILSAVSPIVGGVLYGIQRDLAFYYVAGLFALATLLLLVVPLKTPQRAAVGSHAGHHEEAAARGGKA